MIYLEFIENILPNYFCSRNKVFTTKWFRKNSTQYSLGLILINDLSFNEIKNIIVYENEYYFLCLRYACKGYDSFFNCAEILECNPPIYSIIRESIMTLPKSYYKR